MTTDHYWHLNLDSVLSLRNHQIQSHQTRNCQNKSTQVPQSQCKPSHCHCCWQAFCRVPSPFDTITDHGTKLSWINSGTSFGALCILMMQKHYFDRSLLSLQRFLRVCYVGKLRHSVQWMSHLIGNKYIWWDRNKKHPLMCVLRTAMPIWHCQINRGFHFDCTSTTTI